MAKGKNHQSKRTALHTKYKIQKKVRAPRVPRRLPRRSAAPPRLRAWEFFGAGMHAAPPHLARP